MYWNRSMSIKPVNAGRPRSQQAHDAVIVATKRLIETLPYPDVSVDRIVAESGVSKRTIYRWWSNKAAIILEVVSSKDVSEPNTGSLEGDLIALLTGIFNNVTTNRTSDAIRGLLADAQFNPEFAEQFRVYIVDRRQVCLNIIQRAIDRGELSQDVNAELTADLIYGPYWYRLLIGHAPLSEAFAQELVKSIVKKMQL
jgi:AcrR family transcriptional regulator